MPWGPRALAQVRTCFVASLLFLFVNVASLRAQAQNATISGTATDASGAALVGAKIQITNVATGTSQSTVTDAQGRYTVPDLPVGTYDVQASLSGFQTVVQKAVTLAVGSTVVVNLSMPVGQVSQTVSVEGEVSRVETQTTEVSNLVAPQQVANLPLNGRNIEQLLTLTPGVTALAPAVNAVTGRLYGMQDNYSISGARPTGQMFLLDGTDIRDFWEHGIGSGYAGTELGIESISQFQVITNTATAQYAGNGVVNEVSKSGTNDLHGSAYEFIRNSALDARDINDPVSGPPPFRQNQFGGSIGGPIKKDKLFYFANYEGLRRSLGATSIPFGVPEPYVSQGYLPCGAPGTPTTTNGPFGPSPNVVNSAPQCVALTGTQTTWPNVTGTQTAPAGSNPIEPVAGALPQAQQIAALYTLCRTCRPVATVTNGISQPAGTDVGGFTYNTTAQPLVTNEDYVLGRVDYSISSRDTMFGRYLIDDARVVNGPQDPLGIFPEDDYTRNQYVTIAENHIVSATMVNVLRFGFVRTNENSRTALGLSPAQLSEASTLSGIPIPSDPLDLVRTAYNEPERPDGQVTPYTTALVTPLGPNPDRPDTLIDNKFSGGDDLDWTHGAHTLKVGVVVTRVQVNNRQVAYAAGQTDGFGSMQAFLLGTGGVGFAVPPGFADADRYFRETDVAPYFQDDWRVTPRLTLNLGLRYDFSTNPVGWAGNGQPLTALIGSFLPPIGPQAPIPNCSGTLEEVAICSLGVFSPVKHVFANNPNSGNWQPRFGIAYSPFGNNRTAIRAGFGVFYDPTAARIYESGFIATPPAASMLLIPICFPDAFAATCTGSAVPAPSEFAGVSYQNTNGSPYDLQYNFNIQQQIAPATVLTVGYVGLVARHLWNQRDINPPKCLTFPDCAALPSYNAPNTGVQFPFSTIFGIANNPGPRINPAFGEMVTEATTAASSYNSLQISVNRQFSRTLSFQASYTYSHCIDDGSFATSLEEFAQLQLDPYNQSYDYGNCIFDVRHNLSVNGLYALPFKGNRLVEGWQLATILGVHSGLPVNVYNGSTIDPANLGTEWASRANYAITDSSNPAAQAAAKAAGCHPNKIIDKAIAPGIIQWFDPVCYTQQADGFLGNIGRNSAPGPGTLNLDFSVLKNTKITEKLNMQFRAEFFNIMNHFNPGAPSGAVFTPTHTDGQVTLSQAPVVTPRQIQFAVKFEF